MEVRYGGVEEKKNKHGRIKYFAAAGLLVAGIAVGTGYNGTKEGMAMVGGPEPTSTFAAGKNDACESVFTPEAEQVIERKLDSAVRTHSRELKSRIGSTADIIVNFSIGVDGSGKVHVQDAWTAPESNLTPSEIARIIELKFDDMRLAAPSEGHMCSYSMPIPTSKRT